MVDFIEQRSASCQALHVLQGLQYTNAHIAALTVRPGSFCATVVDVLRSDEVVAACLWDGADVARLDILPFRPKASHASCLAQNPRFDLWEIGWYTQMVESDLGFQLSACGWQRKLAGLD